MWCGQRGVRGEREAAGIPAVFPAGVTGLHPPVVGSVCIQQRFGYRQRRQISAALEVEYDIGEIRLVAYLPLSGGMGLDYWTQVIEVRDAVNKELEAARVAGVIGGALDAEVGLYCGREILDKLNALEDELRFVFITSEARTYLAGEPPAEAQHHMLSTGDEVWISVSASNNAKCVRCWHHREDVGSHSEHPELCGRCVGNVDGDGESRRFA